VVAPPGTPAEDKVIRSILKRVMDERKISQGWIASIYMGKYGCQSADQHKVSSWFRYKIPPMYMESFNDYAAYWLRDNGRYIDEVAREVIRLYLSWREKRKQNTAVPSDYQELLNAIKLYNGEEVDSSSTDDEHNLPILDILQKLQLQPQPAVVPAEGSDQQSYAMDIESYETPVEVAAAPVLVSVDEDLQRFIASHHILSVFDLHKFVFKELRRRNLIFGMLVRHLEAKIRESNIEESLLTNFLSNRKLLDPVKGGLIVYYLIHWLMQSTKVPDAPQPVAVKNPNPVPNFKATSNANPRQVSATDGRSKCPYCTAVPNDFTTALGFSMHVSWCRRRYEASAPSTAANTSNFEIEPVNEEVAFPEAIMTTSDDDAMTEDANPSVAVETAAFSASHQSSTATIPQHRLLQINQSNVSDVEAMATEEDPSSSSSLIGSSLLAQTATNSPEHQPPSKRVKLESENIDSSRPASASQSNIGRYSEPAYTESAVIAADKFPAGSHYYACELCKRPEASLLCAHCPCSYHLKCAISAFKVTPSTSAPYICGTCE
jgi:hypothetical protein